MNPDPSKLLRKIEVLSLKVETLRKENTQLKRKIEIFEMCPSIRNGFMGEELISGIINGTLTTHTAPHDIVLKDGRRIEVKFSNLNKPNKGSESTRWSWNYPTGLRGGKAYHSLILVGVADYRYQDLYLDPECPYVIFDVPRKVVKRLNQRGNHISITTDPSFPRAGTRMELFTKYQTSMKLLRKEYGFRSRSKISTL